MLLFQPFLDASTELISCMRLSRSPGGVTSRRIVSVEEPASTDVWIFALSFAEERSTRAASTAGSLLSVSKMDVRLGGNVNLIRKGFHGRVG